MASSFPGLYDAVVKPAKVRRLANAALAFRRKRRNSELENWVSDGLSIGSDGGLFSVFAPHSWLNVGLNDKSNQISDLRRKLAPDSFSFGNLCPILPKYHIEVLIGGDLLVSGCDVIVVGFHELHQNYISRSVALIAFTGNAHPTFDSTIDSQAMRLLANEKEWSFYAKGNANSVFSHIGADYELRGKLLRLRHQDQHYDTKFVYQFIEEKVRSCLDSVIAMELVEISFKKEGMLNDGYGLLMPCVLKREARQITNNKYYKVYSDNESWTIELKPKWLLPTAYGCRNCAHHKYKHKSTPTFCPMELCDLTKMRSTVESIGVPEQWKESLVRYLENVDNILLRLKRLQTELALETLQAQSQVTEDLCFQMTIRDVTVYLTFPFECSVPSVTITDVDPKFPCKWSHWATTERELINSFY